MCLAASSATSCARLRATRSAPPTRRGPDRRPSMRRSLIREGIGVGLAGAVAVAAWFLLYDLAAGVPFRTPALLGAAIFDGLRDPAALVITPALVLKYTVLHGLAFLAFGIATAGLFALVDYERRVLFAVFMLFCCFEVFVIGMVMALAE